MIRIISLSEDDILFDRKAAGETLDKAVRRKTPLRFTGICPIGGTIMFVFNECAGGDPGDRDAHFVFSQLPSRDPEEVSATILSRYSGGFDTLGTFSIGDDLWGLFKRIPGHA